MNITNYINAINTADNFGEIREVGIGLAETLGCDYFWYAGITQFPISSLEVMMIGNYPEEWLMRYQEKEYARIDPRVWHCTHAVVPLLWCDMEMENEAVSEFFQDARDYGIISGISIPLHSGSGYTAILTFGSSTDNESIYETLREEMANLLLFGYNLHNRVIEYLIHPRLSGEREPLSELERKCLLWAAEGKTTWEIGTILSLKERSVVFHLANAGKKLRAVNRQQAIACAIALGEIRSSIAAIPEKITFSRPTN